MAGLNDVGEGERSVVTWAAVWREKGISNNTELGICWGFMVYISISVCICWYVWIDVRRYIYIYTYTYIHHISYIYIHMYNVYIYIYICICICIYIYTRVYIYTLYSFERWIYMWIFIGNSSLTAFTGAVGLPHPLGSPVMSIISRPPKMGRSSVKTPVSIAISYALLRSSQGVYNMNRYDIAVK